MCSSNLFIRFSFRHFNREPKSNFQKGKLVADSAGGNKKLKIHHFFKWIICTTSNNSPIFTNPSLSLFLSLHLNLTTSLWPALTISLTHSLSLVRCLSFFRSLYIKLNWTCHFTSFSRASCCIGRFCTYVSQASVNEAKFIQRHLLMDFYNSDSIKGDFFSFWSSSFNPISLSLSHNLHLG